MTAVALVGVTASGKSEAALEVARRRSDVEIVSVDSMCVYREMDLGTSKPSREVRAEIPHHLIDLVEPDQEFTVAEFQRAARVALDEIAARRHHAVLVGGTGLYLRSVIDELAIPGRYPDVVAGLEAELAAGAEVPDLHTRLAALDPVAASRMEPTNRRRVVRALEVTIGSGQPFSHFGPGLESYPTSKFPLFGIAMDVGEVDRRIGERFAGWLEAGLAEEVRALASRPAGISRTARQALGYRELLAHVEGGADLDECVVEAVRRTRALARRQASWFRRDPRITWIDPGDGAADLLDQALGARPAAMTCENGVVHCTKHEGAGNDFIVVLDPGDDLRLSVGQVRLLADRRRGIGADGIIRVGPGRDGCDLSMELRNADGSEAEMSGNGIRCLAQAAVDAGLVSPPSFMVATAGGVRTVTYEVGVAPGWATASVDMGPVTLGPDQPQDFDDRRARTAEVGNPHLVLLGAEVASVHIAELGPKLQSAFPDGINVEWIAARADREGEYLEFRVWERGVGETLACGTGSVAAAAAARSWGAVAATGPVRMLNPGGMLEVTLGEHEGDPAYLAGPVRKVADIDVHPGMLS